MKIHSFVKTNFRSVQFSNPDENQQGSKDKNLTNQRLSQKFGTCVNNSNKTAISWDKI